MTVSAPAFLVVAALVVAAAAAAVGLNDRRHAALALGAALAATGVLEMVLGAELTGAVQLAVGLSVGPVLLLVAAGPGDDVGQRPGWRRYAVGGGLAGAVAAGLAVVLAASRGDLSRAPWPSDLADSGTARAVAHALLAQSVLPLAVVAVVLAVAAGGGLLLARTDEHEAALDRAERLRREREERSRRRREDRVRGRARGGEAE